MCHVSSAPLRDLHCAVLVCILVSSWLRYSPVWPRPLRRIPSLRFASAICWRRGGLFESLKGVDKLLLDWRGE